MRNNLYTSEIRWGGEQAIKRLHSAEADPMIQERYESFLRGEYESETQNPPTEEQVATTNSITQPRVISKLEIEKQKHQEIEKQKPNHAWYYFGTLCLIILVGGLHVCRKRFSKN